MGKPIGEDDLGRAHRQLKECKIEDCATRTRDATQGYCKNCRQAYQLVKASKRTAVRA